MYIKFNSIEINNFGSVGNIFLEIEPGITQVRGQNLDNSNSESNGSGKSTVFSESFRWVIYGDTSKKLSSDGIVNDEVNYDCFVKLNSTITDDSGNQFPVEIERYRKHSKYKNSLKFFVDGKDETRHKVSDTQKEIERLFRLPINVFSCVYLMEQGMDGKFTSMSNIEGKNYIESLRNIKIWEQGYFKSKESEKKRFKERDLLDSLNNQNLAVISSKLRDLDSIQDKIANKKQEISEEDIDETYKIRLEDYTNNSKIYQEKKINLEEGYSHYEISKEKLSLFERKVSENFGKIRELNSQRKEFELKKSESFCSACGREFENSLEASEHYEKEIIKIENKLKPLLKESSQDDRLISDTKEKLDILKKSLDQEKNELKKKHDYLVSSHLELKELKNKNKFLEKELEFLLETLSSSKKEYDSLNESNKKVSQKIKIMNEEIPYYTEVKNLFSFTGIRSFLILNDIEFLNERMREFSTCLFSDMIVQLKPTLNNQGLITLLDVISIFSDKKERPYSKLSGGEKRRADLCIQLSIREFVKTVYNVSTNLFSLDEIFEGLDKEGVTSVMQLINEVSDPNSSIYVISHRYVDSFNGKSILVVKENSITRLSN